MRDLDPRNFPQLTSRHQVLGVTVRPKRGLHGERPASMEFKYPEWNLRCFGPVFRNMRTPRVFKLLALALAFSIRADAQLSTERRAPEQELVPPLWGNLPPGPYTVGFRTVFRYDGSRTWKSTRHYDGSFSPDLKGRPIQFNIWYPASPDPSSTKMHFGDYVDQSVQKVSASSIPS